MFNFCLNYFFNVTQAYFITVVRVLYDDLFSWLDQHTCIVLALAISLNFMIIISVQLLKHCISNSERHRTRRSGVLWGFSGFFGFFWFEKIVFSDFHGIYRYWRNIESSLERRKFLCYFVESMFLRELVKVPDVLCEMLEWLIYEVKWPILADRFFLTCHFDDRWKKLPHFNARCHLIETSSLLVRTGLRKLSAKDKRVGVAFFSIAVLYAVNSNK